MLSHTALGTWSGGRFMRFGVPLDDERLLALFTPDDRIRTVITADVYGEGEADRMLGRALGSRPRDSFHLVGAIGHDFYDGERQGAKGFPRFTHPDLRGPEGYADYICRATEAQLERLGTDRLDLLLLHNPDRTGYSDERVWEGMRAMRDAGLTDAIGVAPGPANGFTLDLIDCFERFGSDLDWAMIILNPFEPWPGELVLPAAREYGVDLITRVVDYGGIFHDDVKPDHPFPDWDHRTFRPEGWVIEGNAKLDEIRPIAERNGLTPLQLACEWNLAQHAVRCVVPTLIQEPGETAKTVEAKRAELADVAEEPGLSDHELATIRAIGDNTNCMTLKGANPAHEGDAAPDRWPLDEDHKRIAARWNIAPERDLARLH